MYEQEQEIEKLESIDPVQSEHRMTTVPAYPLGAWAVRPGAQGPERPEESVLAGLNQNFSLKILILQRQGRL
ncbi:hypothetical protein TNCV_133851 [Trichonephila clavipes]|nr:hypothetical protein TNCV_133851 [Trichonephila clavipes]